MLYSLPTPFTFVALPYLILGVVIEALIIWLFMKKYNLNLIKLGIVVLIGNALTAFTGLFVALGSSFIANLYWYLAMFLINVIIESSFYIAYYARQDVSKTRFIIATAVANFVTFLIIGYGLFIDTGLTQKYLHLLGIQLI